MAPVGKAWMQGNSFEGGAISIQKWGRGHERSSELRENVEAIFKSTARKLFSIPNPLSEGGSIGEAQTRSSFCPGSLEFRREDRSTKTSDGG
jgi:hypothetical protein